MDEWTRVAAWLFVPEGREDIPGILCCHQAVAQGKDEPAGIDGDPNFAFARRYAELGYVTLAPDCIAAGERVGTGLAPYDTANHYADQPKLSAMGRMFSEPALTLSPIGMKYILATLCSKPAATKAVMGKMMARIFPSVDRAL